MQDLLSLSLPELESWLAAFGEPRFRARQLYDWLYGPLRDRYTEDVDPAGKPARNVGK